MTTPEPDFARLHPYQQMGMACARCGRQLGGGGQPIGEQILDEHGFGYQLWACDPCPPRTIPRRPQTDSA